MSILLICICGVLAACSNDNIYEKEDSGFVIRSKELISEVDITLATPWKFKYNVIDYSNTDGNTASIVTPGDFYYYSSSNYLVGDTLLFTTKGALRSVDSLQEHVVRIGIEKSILADDLRKQIVIYETELQKTKDLKEKNIELQANLTATRDYLTVAKAKNQKLIKFKNDLKKLVVITESKDSATP